MSSEGRVRKERSVFVDDRKIVEWQDGFNRPLEARPTATVAEDNSEGKVVLFNAQGELVRWNRNPRKIGFLP